MGARKDKELLIRIRADIQKAVADLRTVGGEVEKSAAVVSKASAQTKKSTQANQENTESYLALAGAVKTVVVAFASYKLGGIIKESALLASRNETLGIVLETVARNAGKTKGEVQGLVEDVKALGITTGAANKTIIQMTRLQLDLNKATELSRVAQDAAVVGSVNSSEALDRLLHGIVTLQPEVLRQIGITISLEQEYVKFSKTTGKTANELTQLEKQQIAMNAVLREGEKLQGTYAAAMETANKQMSSLVRLSAEAQNELGKMFQPAFRTGISATTTVLEGLTETMTSFNFILGTSGLETASLEKINGIVEAIEKKIAKIKEENGGDTAIFDGATSSRLLQLRRHLESIEKIRNKISNTETNIIPKERLFSIQQQIENLSATVDYFKNNNPDFPALKTLEQKLSVLIEKQSLLVNGDLSGNEPANAAAEKLNKDLQKQLFLLGENTEAKILYAVANGDLIDTDGALVQKLLESARALDAKKTALKAAADEAKNQQADDGLIESLAFEVSLIGASEQATEQLTAIKKLSADATDAQREAVAALIDAMLAAAAAQKQFEADMAAGLKITEETRTAEENLAAQKREINRLYREGALGAVDSAEAQDTLNRAIKKADDNYDAMQKKGIQAYSALSSAAHSWSRDFADRLLDGERSFSGFADAIIREIQRIALTAAFDPLFQSIAAGFGSVFNPNAGSASSSASSSVGSAEIRTYELHTGGIAGGSGVSRSVNSALFTNAPRYHSGGIVDGEVPAILQKGEGVFTKEQMANLSPVGGTSGSISVTIDNSGTPQQIESAQAEIDPNGLVVSIMTTDLNRGGPISTQIASTFNLRRGA